MKLFHRILSIILCGALLLPSIATTVFATASARAVPSAPTELDELSSYLHASVAVEDNTSHLPVNVHTYYDSNKEYTPSTIGEAGSVSILYVMNTNTERLGRKSDAELVQSFLDRGYFVIVLDYQNNPAACGTALDWSTQDIRCQVIGGNPFSGGSAYTSGTYTDGVLAGTDPICAQSYILPAGYDIAYNVPYFSYDKHGVAGTFENIVEIWNNDFKSVKRNTIVKWVDENGVPRLDATDAIVDKAAQDNTSVNYATWFKTAEGGGAISQSALSALSAEAQKAYPYTYIGNTYASEVTDCVQPDGTMIDLNLYFDIIYPSDYNEQLPVMIAMSSNYTRAASWTGETRPYLNGPLFNGYVGIVSDYGLVPMCRNDHYGYFCGDSQLNSVSGDNATYSLSFYNGIHSDTALLRTIRKIGVEGMDIDGYGRVDVPMDPERIGAYGNSKAGVIVRLANPTPEKLAELRSYEGHNEETRLEAYEGSYPYVDPYISNGATTDSRIAYPTVQPALTYSDGEVIHSGLNFVFANCGGASNTLTEGSAPIFGVGTQAGEVQGSYYTYYATTANLARNLDIPFFGLVAPKIAHDLGYGLDKDYGVDILEAFNRYTNYWLKNENPECIIVDVDTTQDICVASDVVMDNVYEVTEDSSIKLQFTGPISASEIEKVKIVSLSDGSELSGAWYGSYGNQQWKFIPYDIQDATYYTVVVPTDIAADNGKYLKESVTHTFRTASGVTDNDVTVTSVKSVTSIDCVNVLPERSLSGHSWSGALYGTSGEGFIINVQNLTSNYNTNQNIRFYIFNDIWSDESYVGKTVRFTFDAKATDTTDATAAVSGNMKLSLTQTGTGNPYVWGLGYGGLDETVPLTNEWRTFTYEFTVTQDMYDCIANGTIASPGLGLALRFPGFTDGSTYNDVKITFRNIDVSAVQEIDNPSLSGSDPIYFTLPDKDYSTDHRVDLRFAVANDAANVVGVYAENGDKLGEVVVTGAGVYSFDVTEYVKSCDGAPVVSVKLEDTVGSSILHDFNYENSTNGIYFNIISKSTITDEIPNSDGTANTSAKLEYAVRSAYYIDLDGNLVSKYTGSLFNFASSSNGLKAGAFGESDYGRRFRISFRVYDETSRVVNVRNGYGYNFTTSTADFKGTDYSFYTTAGEWTTVTIEFTVDDEMYYGDVLGKHVFLLDAENKSIAVLDADAAVNVGNMAAATSKPGNYAGSPGLNSSYTKYSNVGEALAAGKVTFYEDLSYGLYFDDIVFEEISTGVDLASAMLSITPTVTSDILPTVSASVLSTSPDSAQDGLIISGGEDGFDTNSIKSYVKLSLDSYFGGYAAFLFNAKSQGSANVSVYGVSDVTLGEGWSSDTITSANAPANDIYSSGVNVNAVYGSAPLATFAVGSSTTACLVDLSEFAEYMYNQGADEITLVLVSDAKNVTSIDIVSEIEQNNVIAEFDCVNVGVSSTAAGYTLNQKTYNLLSHNGEAFQIDTRAITSGVAPNPNVQVSIFEDIWADEAYVGKTIEFSFSAKATEAGIITLALNKRQLYAFTDFPGFAESAALDTDWQTFTYRFTVTQQMYDLINNTSSGIDAPGLSLGISFTDFSDDGTTYNAAQIMFRDFVVTEVVDEIRIAEFDCVNVGVTSTAAGYSLNQKTYNLLSHTGSAFQIDTRAITSGVTPNPNVQVSIFEDIWADTSYVGKTIRFSFAAKATEAGIITLALNKRQLYAFTDFPGFSASADLTTEWRTFTYEFVVTQQMYDLINNTSSGIDAPGLSLGISFTDFSDDGANYNAAQILFRNFVVNEVVVEEENEEEIVYTEYDFNSSKPSITYSGYSGSNIYAITDGALEIYAGKITNGNVNQNFRALVFNDVFGDHTENIGKTFRVIFKAKATTAGRLDLSLNSTGGTQNAFQVYPGHTYAFDLSTEYQTFSFTFVALEGMYDRTQYNDIALGIRLFNGFYENSAYKDATVSIDDVVIVEDPYIRSVDVTYDFATNKPTANFSGYSTQIGSITNGVFEITPNKSTSCNAGQYARVFALDKIWENAANSGRTFSVTFRAKATVAGAVDFSINKNGTFNNYSYGGTTYTQQYALTTEYQTFTYTFTAIDDMFTTNAATNLVCAFRFYNGYRDTGTGLYKDVTIHIDEISVFEEFSVDNTTVGLIDSEAVSGAGNYNDLTVYADDSATGAPKIYKTYAAYDLSGISTAYGATLDVTLSGSNGETVRVYVLSGVELPEPLTYSNAPFPTGAAAIEFTAVNGVNTLDLSAVAAANAGKQIVLLFTIEEQSGNVVITAAPELSVAKDFHDYTSDSQRHTAIAPTYTTPGNVEFYTCSGCEKLYVKNGEEFVEVSVEDVILPTLKYESVFSGASLNIGKDLSIRYHVTLGGTESADDLAVRFTMNGKSVTVSDYTIDEQTGRYVFTFSGIAPQCMGDNIVAELFCNGALVTSKDEYSVRTYVEEALELYPDYTELAQLLSDMLHYGAAAQKYVGYKTDSLVTDGVNIPAASGVVPDEGDRNRYVTSTDSDIRFISAGVRFDCNNQIFVKITADSLDGVTMTANGVNVEILATNQDNVYIAYSDAISALKFGYANEFELYVDGEVVQTLVYTVNDYALSKYNSASIGELALALYRYGKSAIAYNDTL